MLPINKVNQVDQSISAENTDELLKDIKAFNNSTSFKQTRTNFRLQKKRVKFLRKMEVIINAVNALPKDDNKLQSIFLFVLQSATDYIYDTNDVEQSERLQNQAVLQLLKPMVNDSEELCQQIINIVKVKVKKSTWYRRNKKYIGKFFLLLVKYLSNRH